MDRHVYSTSDLSRKSGDIIADALRAPVTITQRNKPRLVILNVEDYRNLRARADARRVGTVDAVPDDLLAEIEHAVDAYADDEPSGDR